MFVQHNTQEPAVDAATSANLQLLRQQPQAQQLLAEQQCRLWVVEVKRTGIGGKLFMLRKYTAGSAKRRAQHMIHSAILNAIHCGQLVSVGVTILLEVVYIKALYLTC